jgi:lipopolysaccharide transport system permease protein
MESTNTPLSQDNAPNRTVFEKPFLVITPLRGWFHVDLKELWNFRELLYFLIWRDIKIKYKQALLGFAWAIIVPFVNMLIFGFIFGKVAGLSSYQLDPFLFYFSALVPWQYFATAVNMASQSMVSQQELLTKIYLPRLFIPAAACLASLLDYFLAFIMLLVMMVWMGVIPVYTTILIPGVMLIAITTALGVSFFFSALNVKYRDIKFVIPFLIQIWMYISVLLPYMQIPERLGPWRCLYGLNPMGVVIEVGRWCMMYPYMFFDAEKTMPVPLPLDILLVGIASSLLIFLFGLFYFKRMEQIFADIV